MINRQQILGLKKPSEFSLEERQKIVQEYLTTGCKKRDIWEKYTGLKEEHGQILRWMRQLGHEIAPKFTKLASYKTEDMPKNESKQSIEELQLKEKIKQLEQALVNSELRATALETMIEVAEKELKINIRKKVQYQTIYKMKERKPTLGLSIICRLFGITRQAYYQYLDRNLDIELEEELIVKEVLNIRKQHPRIGTRKLYVLLKDFMLEHQIKMGRDALFDLLSVHNLLIRRRKRLIKTTISHHWLKKYPNLIKELIPTRPNELLVSDITYWKTKNQVFYIHLVTDAYSRKIIGYTLSETLEAEHSVQAMQMALSAFEGAESHLPVIHHSDRGVQYCSQKYVKLLQDNDIKISMTENGDPLENAIAERVNGILKEEYLNNYVVENYNQAKELLDAVIKLYNNERPHMSIGNITPEKVHSNELNKGKSKWKNYYQKKELVNQF